MIAIPTALYLNQCAPTAVTCHTTQSNVYFVDNGLSQKKGMCKK